MIKGICEDVLRKVYDFSEMTNEELRCKFFQKLQECIEVCNNSSELLDWLKNEGLEKEVNELLTTWKNDGTLGDIINTDLFSNLKLELMNKINENTNEMNSFIEKSTEQINNFDAKKADKEIVDNIVNQDYKKLFKKIKATNFYVPYSIEEFGDYKTIIDNIKRVGNTHISFCIRLSMAEKTSNQITKDVNDTLVTEYVDYAISKGLKIIIKFHVGGAGGGGSANIQPTNTSLWIHSLRDIALSYCDLLGDKIDIICLSNECTYQTNQCFDDWKNYNDRVKAKNPKYITTTACTDVEMGTTVLYDIVDALGVNLYIGVGGDLNTPQYERDKNMFINYSDKENKIHEVIKHAKKHNKPFFITEVGCTPCVEALKYPAKWGYKNFIKNTEAQKLYYETFLKCFMDMEIIDGIFLWCANDGFTYLNNPAEEVVIKYFTEVE